jgi:hypothetical protein
MHHLRDLNWCLDQAANMSMKIPVLGSAFGILVAAFTDAVQARDTAAIRYLRLSHGLTASGLARDRAVRMRMVSLVRARIGNPRAAITAYASTMNGSTSLMMP